MKKRILLPLFVVLAVSAHSQCYELMWSDEFDYSGAPDPVYWTHETGGGGFGNNELQYYTSSTDNAAVDTGYLTITARKENYGGRSYTSARLITREKYTTMYGKIEARIRLPYGQGIWPAFWMMGEDIGQVGWPACGEIDILEMVGGVGRDDEVHGTVHWDNSGDHASYGGSYSLESGIFADDFHLFSVEWTPSAIRWFVDGTQYHVINITGDELSEFHQDFFILLNLAVGGNWPGSPDGTTVFPQSMDIDFVRVYKKSSDVANLEIRGDDTLPPGAQESIYELPYSTELTYNWLAPEGAEIIEGQGTERVILNWGCDPDTLRCEVTGSCESYMLEKVIQISDALQGPMFIEDNEEEVVFMAPAMTGTQYQWTVPADATVVSGINNDTLIVNWGATFEPVNLELSGTCGTRNLQFDPIRFGQYPFPEIDQPHAIPGTIRSVDFDYGGEGIAYHDVSSSNEGAGPRQESRVDTEFNDNGNPNVGWISDNEWLEYTVSVDTPNWYKLSLRVATDNAQGGPFSVLFNEEIIKDGITVDQTGGWDQFITIPVGTFYLTESDTLLKIMFDKGGFNLGNIIFTTGRKPVSVNNHLSGQMKVFPVPAGEYITVTGLSDTSQICLVNMNGQLLRNYGQSGTGDKIKIDISGIESGIYLLRLTSPSGNMTWCKLVKK